MAGVRFVVISVLDAGNDVLAVTGQDVDGNQAEVEGWVSATTNHFDVADDGTRKGPRTMTPEEVGQYALDLLNEAFPEPTPEPTPVDFVAP